MPSVIFVTLSKRGKYHDFFENHTSLNWCGQTKGIRDSLVVPGTEVWIRNSQTQKSFQRIGTVAEKILIRERDNTRIPGDQHATYRLLLAREPEIVIDRAPGDHYCHNAVLRHLGGKEEKGALAHGIYGW